MAVLTIITTVNNNNSRDGSSLILSFPDSASVALLVLEHSDPGPLCTCFLMPRLKIFLPGLLLTPLRSVFTFYPLVQPVTAYLLHCTPQLLAFPLLFMFLHHILLIIISLTGLFYLFCLFPTPQECKLHEDRDFCLFHHC